MPDTGPKLRTEALAEEQPDVVLRVRDLRQWFPIRRGLLRRVVGHVKAVDGVSFDLHAGETLGLVGESGCGKTSLIQSILRLEEPTRGRVEMRVHGRTTEVTALSQSAFRPFRRSVQLVFQSPTASMNPRFTVFDVIAEPLRLNGWPEGSKLRERVNELLEAVGLSAGLGSRPPRSFSGGQQQRIGIARALALEPEIVIADEPVSALDVSVQSQVLNLMNELKSRLGLSYLFIAHNLNVVRYLSDRIAVMYLGRIVEVGTADEVYAHPLHPYTRSLVDAIPAEHPSKRGRGQTLAGDLPDPANPPSGCRFHPRCPNAIDRCRAEDAHLRTLADGRLVACHLADDIAITRRQS